MKGVGLRIMEATRLAVGLDAIAQQMTSACMQLSCICFT